MNDAIINLVVAVIGVAIAAITRYVIPWIKSKITESKWEQLISWAVVAIRAAKQTFPPEENEAKKEWVRDYLHGIITFKLHINVNEDDLDRIIEGVYNEIKEAEKKAS